MQLLIDRGADVNAECNLYGGGNTTMGLLVTSIHPVRAGLRRRLVEILLNAGATGADSIAGAASLGRLDLVQRFSPTRDEMQAAFRAACEYGRTAVAEFLLERGVEIGAQDGNGMTGLHVAAMGPYLDTVKMLLSRKAPLEPKNVWGGSVLGGTLWASVHYDPNADYAPIVEALLRAGAHVEPYFQERINEIRRRHEKR